jgi:multidrug transporter EmrE-like cation transporter
MTYLYLGLAVIFEVGWAIGLKLSEGFTRLPFTLATGAMYILSLALLMLAVRKMEIGTAYAIWAGLGMAIIAAIGILFFGDKATPLKLISLAMITAGVVGVNLAGAGHAG